MPAKSITKNERGSALIVGLILLLALTILGVAGMNMSRMELAMTANSQFYSSAKVAALSRADLTMDQSNLEVGKDVPPTSFTNQTNASDGSYASTYKGQGPVPGGGFSLGGTFSAQHYEFDVAISETGLPVDVQIRQGAYLIGPGN